MSSQTLRQKQTPSTCFIFTSMDKDNCHKLFQAHFETDLVHQYIIETWCLLAGPCRTGCKQWWKLVILSSITAKTTKTTPVGPGHLSQSSFSSLRYSVSVKKFFGNNKLQSHVIIQNIGVKIIQPYSFTTAICNFTAKNAWNWANAGWNYRCDPAALLFIFNDRAGLGEDFYFPWRRLRTNQ